MAYLFAYLDPGAGSMILQMILAGILGLSYTIKLYWRRIVRFVRRDKDPDETTEETAPVKEHP
jgi:hypothetical protein